MDERGVSFEGLLGRPPNDAERKNAPRRFHVRGPLRLPLGRPRVSIVGTRKPSERGLANAEKMSGFLAARDVTIVSGLAAGIDAAAHRASMDGGSTVAVLGTPLERAYPAQNRGLQDEIMKGHLAVSEFAPGSPVRPGNFVMRDRTMALISDAAVIVEAGAKSGTEHLGREAVRLARPLFLMDTVPDAPWVESLRERGAARLRDPEDIEEFLPQSGAVCT